MPATVEDLMEIWLARQRPRLRESSFVSYWHAVHKYIEPRLGSRALRELSRPVLEEFVDALRGMGLGEKSVWDINVKLNAALNWAVKIGALEHADFCVKTQFTPNQSRTLTPEEWARLERYAAQQAEPVSSGLLLCLETGIGAGELCALRWPQVDLSRQVLVVNQRMQRLSDPGRASGSQGLPGKKTSVALIPVDARRAAIPPRLAARLGRLPHEDGAFFLTGKNDRYLEPRLLQSRAKACLKNAGLDERINFNVLRATFLRSALEQEESLSRSGRPGGAKGLERKFALAQ